MPKHKKTRKQKLLADKRREVVSTSFYSFFPESPKQQAKQEPVQIKPAAVTTSVSYQYLGNDLRKTAFFTGIIVIIELVLRSFIK